jgi:hypothetical protein
LAGGKPKPNEFVLQVRRGSPLYQSSDRTWGNRIARVEEKAGLKVAQKAAHILRATYITQTEEAIGTVATKQYAGHGSARGGATDQYVDRRPPFIPTAHRTFLHLPHPDFVAVLAAGESFR